MNRPQPIHGEVIAFSRGHFLFAAACFPIAVASLVVGICCLATSFVTVIGSDLATSIWGFIALVGGGFLLRLMRGLLESKPRLVLGDDRMQWLEGGRVTWEVPYDNFAQLVLVAGPFGERILGIQLLTPDRFEQTRACLPWSWRRCRAKYKKWFGFDLAFPIRYCSEPAERVLETASTCLHRFRRVKEAS